MGEIKIKSGFKEVQEFLKERNINFRIKIQESFDNALIIELVGIGVGIINILIELKKWLSKNKKDNSVVVIVNNVQINLNSDSEDGIREKLK